MDFRDSSSALLLAMLRLALCPMPTPRKWRASDMYFFPEKGVLTWVPALFEHEESRTITPKRNVGKAAPARAREKNGCCMMEISPRRARTVPI